MYRNVLITVLMIGVSTVGFSQTNESKNVDPKVLVKTVVENSQKDLLDKMQHRLKNRNVKIDLPTGFEKAEAQQFLYQDDLIDSVLKAKSHILKDVFVKLCDKSNMPTMLVYDGINIGDIAYKTFETGKKQGQTDSTTFVVPVSFQAQTVAKDGVSDVKYAITFNWEVKVKAKTEKTVVNGKKTKVVVGYVQDGSSKLITSVANPIKFLTSDRENMRKTAQRKIIEWYANLPQTLDKQYAEQAVTAIKAMNVYPDIDLPKNQNFTVTEAPTIKVEIDPYRVLQESDDKRLYTNPTAYIIIAPIFNVSVDNSFKNADLTVPSYFIKDTIRPIQDGEKTLRRSVAKAVVTELDKQLSTYVSSRDAEQKTHIENMFDTTDRDIIEVSHLSKNGSENIKKESVRKYLSLLKGSALTWAWNDDDVELEDSNWGSVIYTVNQEYQSKIYSDYTQKRIYLTYDSTKGTYLIDKIKVVPNSTIIR